MSGERKTESRPKSQIDRALSLIARCEAVAPLPADTILTLLEESEYVSPDRTIGELTWRALRDVALAAKAFNQALEWLHHQAPHVMEFEYGQHRGRGIIILDQPVRGVVGVVECARADCAWRLVLRESEDVWKMPERIEEFLRTHPCGEEAPPSGQKSAMAKIIA